MWEIVWLRPPQPGQQMMSMGMGGNGMGRGVDLPDDRYIILIVVVARVGVAKAKQRLMTQLSHNLLWKLSMEQLKRNRYRYWHLKLPPLLLFLLTAHAKSSSPKMKRIAANWDESEIRRSSQVAIEEAAPSSPIWVSFLRPWSMRVLQFWRRSSGLLPATLQSCSSNSLWQIVYDIMIMLMTLVMSCNCCAWSVPRFSSSSLPAPSSLLPLSASASAWTDYT